MKQMTIASMIKNFNPAQALENINLTEQGSIVTEESQDENDSEEQEKVGELEIVE